MRGTISLLVTSLLLGCLAFDYQAMASNTLQPTSNSTQLVSGRSKPKPPTYRGSGRRDMGVSGVEMP